MVEELVARFFLGGAIVSAFSLAGEVVKPKTFAGLFSAAPSVAVASIALVFAQHGRPYASLEGRSMLVGAAGMLVCALVCAAIARRWSWPIAAGAATAWSAWLLVTFTLAFAAGLWRIG